MGMDDSELQKDLIKELHLGRDFYTDLEQFIMSLVLTYEKLIKVSNEFFEKHGLTTTQFNALMSLSDFFHYQGGVLNQKTLADRLLINKASAGTLIDRLAKNGWVEVRASETDKRAKNVYLTKKGGEKYWEVFEPYYYHMAPLMDGISREEFAMAVRIMHRMRKITSKTAIV